MNTPARKPFEPLPSGASRNMNALFGAGVNKRDRTTTVALSKAAFDVLYREGQNRGSVSVAGMAGFVVDYLVRTGQFPALLDAAIAEPLTGPGVK